MESAEGGIFNILQLKFTPQSWKSITGVSPKESGVSNFFIRFFIGNICIQEKYLNLIQTN